MSIVRSVCDVGIVFALSAEQGCFEDLLVDVTRHETPCGKVALGTMAGKTVATIISGPGRDAARRACETLLVGHRPRLVVSAGFCGALVPRLRRNEVVVASRILSGDGVVHDVDATHLELFDPSEHRRATFVTVDRILARVEEKRTLTERTGGDVCEMESAGVAEACVAHDGPFVAVRVVSDEAGESLPDDLEPLMQAAGQSTWRLFGSVVGTLWRRPTSVKDLLKLKETSLVAADRLAKFLAERIAALPPRN